MSSGQHYEVDLTRTARRALAESLPLDVAIGVGGVYSARVMRDWRVLYVIDDTQHRVTVRDIRHRRDAYRPR